MAFSQQLDPLTAISPIDGRYHNKTAHFAAYFSEFGLIKYRVFVEIEYFKALVNLPIPQLKGVQASDLDLLDQIFQKFDVQEANQVKNIERTTNHDVKAVEYYLKQKLEGSSLETYSEFIHFGLTSQDINNTAIPLSLKLSIEEHFVPQVKELLDHLNHLAEEWRDIPMLARTHGQPASPTRLGKEILVFQERLKIQLEQLKAVAFSGKFGGATGNFNAHYIAYPEIDWHQFGEKFLKNQLGLVRSHPTTQIEHYDHLAHLFQSIKRINTILIDFCRDIWTYISMEYFKQKTIAQEVGSSAMPHKVNPIDFENAEGNLGIANAIFTHLADKLPISRLQRDLTDSTVLRNIGVPIAHTAIAFQSIKKGLGKLLLNEAQLRDDLENNWMVVAEAIQTVLRREGYPSPYEALKALTRGKPKVEKEDIHNFIDQLKIENKLKSYLKSIRPDNYLGQ